MGGGNVYCTICSGPPDATNAEDNDNDSSVTTSDERWLETVVVVYGDCLSSPGSYDWCSWSVNSGFFFDHKKPLKDVILVPKWAAACQTGGSGQFDCSEGYVLMTHETCIRLAAEWSRAIHPSRYESVNVGHTDPSKFFWDSDNHPVCGFFADAQFKSDGPDDGILQAYQQKSRATFENVGQPLVSFRKVRDRMNKTFFFGSDTGCAPDWRDGCEQGYWHDEDWGVTHLKRPDRFPEIHPLDSSSKVNPLSPLTDKGLPLDVVVQLFTEIDWDGSDIRNLESVSRAWRDFFHAPVMQHHFWYKRIKFSLGEWNPTEADWTQSAETVRAALKKSNTMKMDWRRYYNDAGRSLNMQNRCRIRQAVLQLEEIMGHKVEFAPFWP
ncbi:hypothetical protein C8J56DRAFT_1104745 [Mycena floridula]|nr:hypothetical protein C8J56DRAFT_1104745 [Mycena floridula]